MHADIKLDGVLVWVEGNAFILRGHDLFIDNPERRASHTGGRCVTLVHDQQDGLTRDCYLP